MADEIPRRTFLAVTVAAGFSCCDTNTSPEIDWSFLSEELKIDCDKGDIEQILGESVPVGPKQLLKDGSDFTELSDFIDPEIVRDTAIRNGFGVDIQYTIQLLRQEYVMPAEPRLEEEFLRYCKMALDLLHTDLGLNLKKVNWTIVFPGQDYTSDYNGKAFIGRACFSKYTIKLIDKGDKQEMEISYLKGYSGADTIVHDGKFISLGMGPSAILVPFSEVIPLFVFQATIAHASDNEKVILYGETISESLANIEGHKAVDVFGIPNGHHNIDEITQKMCKLQYYRYLIPAIKFAGAVGPASALQLYLKSPADYMAQVQKYSE